MANLMAIAKHESAAQLRMALRSFTEAWTAGEGGPAPAADGTSGGASGGGGGGAAVVGKRDKGKGKEGRTGKRGKGQGGGGGGGGGSRVGKGDKDLRRGSVGGGQEEVEVDGLGDASFFALEGAEGEGVGVGGGPSFAYPAMTAATAGGGKGEEEVAGAPSAPLDWMVGDDAVPVHGAKGRGWRAGRGPNAAAVASASSSASSSARQAASWVTKDGRLPKMGGFEGDLVPAPAQLRRANTFQ
jgi:hypothetical protein